MATSGKSNSLEDIEGRIRSLIPPNGIGILRAVFLQTKTRRLGIPAERFRVDNRKYRQTIERLERVFLLREDDNLQKLEVYKLTRIALPILDAANSNQVLALMAKLRLYLVEEYKAKLSHPIALSNMLAHLGGSHEDAIEAILYLKDSQGFSGGSVDFPLGDNPVCFVSELILDYPTLNDVLEFDLGFAKGNIDAANQPEKSHEVEVRYSATIDAVLVELGSSTQVTSWDLVQNVLARRVNDYGRGRGAPLLKWTRPERAERFKVSDWLLRATSMLNLNNVKVLNGRLLIVALSRIDARLREALQATGFLMELLKDIGKPERELFVNSQSTIDGRSTSDPAPLCLDSPTSIDHLERKSLAKLLAMRLDILWRGYSNSGAKGSFSLHLHGPWGSGKSSLFRLLRDELQPSIPKSRIMGWFRSDAIDTNKSVLPWIIVEFNAWQHQRLDPPWWFLMDAIYHQSCGQLWRRYSQWGRAISLWACESIWRITTRRSEIFTSLTILLFCIGLLYWFVRPLLLLVGPSTSGFPENIRAMGDVLSVLGILLSATLLLSRSLLSGSAKAAQAFLQSAADPMGRVTVHFRGMVAQVRHPIIVLVDDLDRCQSNYVVALLEGIQTMFYDPKVVYFVAADRRWLHACFEKAYSQFSTSVSEPGRTLGSLFLDKAFELSIALPRPRVASQRKYWRALVQSRPMDSSLYEAQEEMHYRQEARRDFATAQSETEVLRLAAVLDSDPIKARARRLAAVERLANAKVEESTEYFLEQFAPLLEFNPRSMKRLLNVYSIQRDMALISGVDLLADITIRKQLALWTILCQRWPILEEYYLAKANGEPVDNDEATEALLRSSAVQNVYSGGKVGVSLTSEAIATFAGFRD